MKENENNDLFDIVLEDYNDLSSPTRRKLKLTKNLLERRG